MRRSEINAILRDAEAFIRAQGFHLPPFAYWSPQVWRSKGAEVAEIARCQLGWDITDFGSGDFDHVGLVLFTLRNGLPENLASGSGKTYAEKLLLVGEQQLTPLHFHWQKMEDIINRGGGQLRLQLYNASPDDALADSPLNISVDGCQRELAAGDIVTLHPGESITLPPRCYHKFWAEGGRVLAGEVSAVNDDANDNRFYDPIGRFPSIEEDSAPHYLLVTDYADYYQP